jgi:hypothetical protein
MRNHNLVSGGFLAAYQAMRRDVGKPQKVMMIHPDDCDEEIADRVANRGRP